MKTPIKIGYGKRKRRSSASLLEWDEQIDSVKSADVSAQTSAPQSVQKPDVGSQNPKETRADLGPNVSRHDHPTGKKKLEKDVYDYDSIFHPASVKKSRPGKTTSSATATLPRDALVQDTSDRLISSESDELATKSKLPPSPAINGGGALGSTTDSSRSSVKKEKGKAKVDDAECEDSQLDIALQDSNAQADAQFEMDLDEGLRRSRRMNDLRGSLGESSAASSVETKRDMTRHLSKGIPRPPQTADESNFEVGQDCELPAHGRSTSLDEVDLEPVFRPATPPHRPLSRIIASPQMSPEHDAVLDVLSNRTDIARSRRGNTRPRRLLEALSKSKRKVEAPSLETKLHQAEKSARSIENLAERAESNLVEHTESQQEISWLQSAVLPQETENLPSSQTSDRASQPVRTTYSKQRSFLLESTGPVTTGRETETTFVKITSDTEDDTIENSTVSIKNVHDLRQGGEYKRFVDEISYILEGLEGQQTMQASLLELSTKLASKEFARRYRAAGFDERVTKASQNSSDPVSLFALMIIISVSLQITDDPRLSKLELRIVNSALQLEDDLLEYIESKSSKLSKINKITAHELRKSVGETDAIKNLRVSVQLSPRFLALSALSLAGEIPNNFLIKSIAPLLQNYRAGSVKTMLETQLISGLLLHIPPGGVTALKESEIESICVITASLLSTAGSHYEHRALAIANFLKTLILLSNGASDRTTSIVNSTLLEVVLKYVLLKVRTATEKADEVVLSLGLLVCLVEESNAARQKIEALNGKSSLSTLLGILHDRLSASENDLVTGYLALLLFYMRRSAIRSWSEMDAQGIRNGLALLQAGTRDVAELQSKLIDHLQNLHST